MKLLDQPKEQTARKPLPILRFDLDTEGIGVITFDQPNSSANVFDEAALRELDRCLDRVSESKCQGLIICSAKPSIFIAGADIRRVLCHPDPEAKASLIELGQTVFQRLADLPIPTVAAIHGACLGGGYELALACDHRIASPDRCTKIGLPETKLGIVPAWGGSTRLPRLIGLPRALDIILGGKAVPAKKARRMGMIDDCVPREHLLVMARRLVYHPRTLPRPRRTNNRLSARVIEHIAKRRLITKTHDCYPAIKAALRLVVGNLHRTESQALAEERAEVLRLAETPEAARLIEIFFLQERAKKRQLTDAPLPRIERTAVIGAGVMGAGMAQWFSARSHPTILTDIDPDKVAAGMDRVAKIYHGAKKRRLLSPVEARKGLDRLSPAVGLVPLTQVDLVLEAAVEVMKVKQAIFRDLELRAGPNTILASNTSALSIKELASATTCPDRVVGLHFFNPVARMPLVEIVQGPKTSKQTVQRCLTFVQKLGKMPVVVRDCPGFVVNRLLLPYLNQAVKLFEEGVDMHHIDEAMLDFGMPMGPLRLVDEVGLDVASHVAQTLETAFGDRLATPKLMKEMTDRDWLGKKAGIGFYDHRGRKPLPNKRLKPLQNHTESAKPSVTSLQERMMMPLIDEAARCLADGVVDDPRDIDFAMIMGTGFAPFRGGPLRHADTLGISHVVDALMRIQHEPAPLLLEMAQNQQRFYNE